MDTIPLETSVYDQIEHRAQICRINWNSAHLLLGLEILTQNPHERARYLALAFGLGLFMSDWQFEKQLWALRVAIVGDQLNATRFIIGLEVWTQELEMNPTPARCLNYGLRFR